MTKTAFEVLVGIFFIFAVGAYWIFERDKTIALVQSLVPRQHRRVTRDTWVLIDQKLGAFVRGELILIVFVAVVLSAGFFAIGLPYWLLIGSFAGLVELVPVIGPLAAGALAVGVGFTQSWHMALFAGLIVLAVRQFEDYVVVPRVLGHAVGLSPLVVLFSVTAIGILLGGFYVLLAIPIAAVLATLVDVVVRDADPPSRTCRRCSSRGRARTDDVVGSRYWPSKGRDPCRTACSCSQQPSSSLVAVSGAAPPRRRRRTTRSTTTAGRRTPTGCHGGHRGPRPLTAANGRAHVSQVRPAPSPTTDPFDRHDRRPGVRHGTLDLPGPQCPAPRPAS